MAFREAVRIFVPPEDRSMRNPKRTSLTIVLSLGLLAMTLGQPALAAGQRHPSRGGKRLVVRIDPSPAPAPPLGAKVGVIENSAALIRLMFTLRF
jgi:hypothetical protein